MDVYEEIKAERAAQLAKGRDAAYDDTRTQRAWLVCLAIVTGPVENLVNQNMATAEPREDAARWRKMWIKVASVAVAAIEAHDRQEARK